jgi:AraC family transcriptional activator of tynA and feaB
VLDPNEYLLTTAELDGETWKGIIRSLGGRYSPIDTETGTFAGRVRPRNLCGLVAMDLSCNALRIERTHRDVRLDGKDHYYIVFQIAGKTASAQNGQIAELAVRDVALIEAIRPVTYFPEKDSRVLTLQLPRRSLISHLGWEPKGGLCRCGETFTARHLFHLVQDAASEGTFASASTETYIQFAIYDFLGALFAESDLRDISGHTGKLFDRICGTIKSRFVDPDFGPFEVATEAGISLRYLQKIFTARRSSCTYFIQSVRLDHAAHLLHRRASLNTGQPVGEIAYASGFNSYSHFARQFRLRFGHPPGAHSRHDRASCGPSYRPG